MHYGRKRYRNLPLARQNRKYHEILGEALYDAVLAYEAHPENGGGARLPAVYPYEKRRPSDACGREDPARFQSYPGNPGPYPKLHPVRGRHHRRYTPPRCIGELCPIPASGCTKTLYGEVPSGRCRCPHRPVNESLPEALEQRA